MSVNPDLKRERARATFNSEELTNVLDGGKAKTLRRREIEKMVFQDKDFQQLKDPRFLSRPEHFDQSVHSSVLSVKKIAALGLNDPFEVLIYKRAIAGTMGLVSFVLHDGAFMPALLGHGSQEQVDKWLPLTATYGILGTYAQTELGHGTHLRKLETTATYDPRTEEFVLHTPTLSSMKWWPGNMAHVSTHVILMAQLYTQGKCYGVHPFWLQIRSMKDHSIMPGIELGDIGPKMGFETVDNGYLKLNYVRIPREGMLMKNAQVLKDGTYIKPPSSKLAYGTMVLIRAMIVNDTARYLGHAVIIATRYSAVRRQSEIEPNGKEPQVIDFVTQQYKIFPILAAAYAFHFAGERMAKMYFSTAKKIEEGDLDLLPELHGVSCSLKATCTSAAAAAVEQCRMSCGGHGYSRASSLPDLYTKVTPSCTYEGENTVLMLQSARYLVKCFTAARSGKQLKMSVAYLSQLGEQHFQFQKGSHFSPAFAHRAKRLIGYACELLNKETSKGISYVRAWNNSSVDLVKAAQAHSDYYVVKNFEDALDQKQMSNSVRAVLTTLCQLYSVYTLLQSAGDFLEDGYMNGSQLMQLKSYLIELLGDVRPNAVALVDAFDYDDKILRSALGSYDGNVYERLYEFAKESTLNKSEIHPSYYKYLKPMMDQARSKL